MKERKIKKITARRNSKTFTWKLFACEYVLNLIKKDKRFSDVEVEYEAKKEVEKPYYWKRLEDGILD
jgi:hypothetical protein